MTRRPSVLTGSHVDTQPSGGKFDGNYGVLAGLEVLRTLNDAGIVTEKPVAVAIWTNEEGSRFVPVMGGSGAFAGVFTIEHLLQQRDVDGITFGDALDRIGYAGGAPVGGRALDAYFEAHIEQGPILEREDKIVGVVTGALGLALVRLHLDGAGCACRADADGIAPRCTARRVRGWSRRSTRWRCGMRRMAAPPSDSCRSSPNSRNVIPGRVTMSVDMRHPDDEHLATMDRELRAAADAIADDLRLECEVRQVDQFPASRFDAELRRCRARRDARRSAMRTARW